MENKTKVGDFIEEWQTVGNAKVANKFSGNALLD